VAIVAGAYFIGRGLAKSGSNDPYTARRDDADGRSSRGGEILRRSERA
jgi:hypothetical protein